MSANPGRTVRWLGAALACALWPALAVQPAAAREPSAEKAQLPIAVAREPGPARKRLQDNLAEVLKTFEAAGVVLPDEDREALDATAAMPDEPALGAIQAVLDRYTLALVDINDEAWFTVMASAKGPLGRPLVQGRWATYLIKVNNESRTTSPFEVRSRQAVDGTTDGVTASAAASGRCEQSPHGWAQWFALRRIGKPAMETNLSGKEIEYFVVQMCSFDAGDRAAEFTFYLGGGQVSQGHYGAIGLLFQPTADASSGH